MQASQNYAVFAHLRNGEPLVYALPQTSNCQNPGCNELARFKDRFCSATCHTRGSSYESSIRQRFGMTLEDYSQMLAAQGGRCAICRALPSGQRPRLHVDHDHVTGLVRGLLCGHCNRGLGGARDNVRILRAMITYLKKQSAPAPDVHQVPDGLW